MVEYLCICQSFPFVCLRSLTWKQIIIKFLSATFLNQGAPFCANRYVYANFLGFYATRNIVQRCLHSTIAHHGALLLLKTYGIMCIKTTLEIYCNYVMMCSLLWIRQSSLHFYLLCLRAAAPFKPVSAAEAEWRNAYEERHSKNNGKKKATLQMPSGAWIKKSSN